MGKSRFLFLAFCAFFLLAIDNAYAAVCISDFTVNRLADPSGECPCLASCLGGGQTTTSGSAFSDGGGGGGGLTSSLAGCDCSSSAHITDSSIAQNGTVAEGERIVICGMAATTDGYAYVYDLGDPEWGNWRSVSITTSAPYFLSAISVTNVTNASNNPQLYSYWPGDNWPNLDFYVSGADVCPGGTTTTPTTPTGVGLPPRLQIVDFKVVPAQLLQTLGTQEFIRLLAEGKLAKTEIIDPDERLVIVAEVKNESDKPVKPPITAQLKIADTMLSEYTFQEELPGGGTALFPLLMSAYNMPKGKHTLRIELAQLYEVRMPSPVSFSIEIGSEYLKVVGQSIITVPSEKQPEGPETISGPETKIKWPEKLTPGVKEKPKEKAAPAPEKTVDVKLKICGGMFGPTQTSLVVPGGCPEPIVLPPGVGCPGVPLPEEDEEGDIGDNRCRWRAPKKPSTSEPSPGGEPKGGPLMQAMPAAGAFSENGTVWFPPNSTPLTDGKSFSLPALQSLQPFTTDIFSMTPVSCIEIPQTVNVQTLYNLGCPQVVPEVEGGFVIEPGGGCPGGLPEPGGGLQQQGECVGTCPDGRECAPVGGALAADPKEGGVPMCDCVENDFPLGSVCTCDSSKEPRCLILTPTKGLGIQKALFGIARSGKCISGTLAAKPAPEGYVRMRGKPPFECKFDDDCKEPEGKKPFEIEKLKPKKEICGNLIDDDEDGKIEDGCGTCNNNTSCEAGEGCNCKDCQGFQGPCEKSQVCNPYTNSCTCKPGMAYNAEKGECILAGCKVGTTYCMNSECSSSCLDKGGLPTCNENNACEAGEGCNCSDCFNRQGPCEPGLGCNALTGLCDCPKGYVWADFGNRCIKRCAADEIYSLTENICVSKCPSEQLLCGDGTTCVESIENCPQKPDLRVAFARELVLVQTVQKVTVVDSAGQKVQDALVNVIPPSGAKKKLKTNKEGEALFYVQELGTYKVLVSKDGHSGYGSFKSIDILTAILLLPKQIFDSLVAEQRQIR